MTDSADPLEGWSIKEVMKKTPLAKKDIYGGLFLSVQGVLLEFCRRIENLKICFHLFQAEAMELPNIIKLCGMNEHYFDRIEVRIAK